MLSAISTAASRRRAAVAGRWAAGTMRSTTTPAAVSRVVDTRWNIVQRVSDRPGGPARCQTARRAVATPRTARAARGRGRLPPPPGRGGRAAVRRRPAEAAPGPRGAGPVRDVLDPPRPGLGHRARGVPPPHRPRRAGRLLLPAQRLAVTPARRARLPRDPPRRRGARTGRTERGRAHQPPRAGGPRPAGRGQPGRPLVRRRRAGRRPARTAAPGPRHLPAGPAALRAARRRTTASATGT